ncbi:hypothetical protein GCM10027290_68020 [Micromonospora sonneratiae]|uniref:Uncharacterized protein n=1 Tax=Micromonospora sonneratiae TaxID=1184706 RepID=A0ABW3YP74_9ACTN
MVTFIDIDGDPNQVSATGAVLRAMAEGFRGKIQGIKGEISGIESERPWGNDKYGKAFETTFNQVPDGGESSLRDSVADGMSRAGDGLIKVGDTTILAMTSYLGVDIEGETEINQVQV